ncbi:MAG: fumarate hydratase [Clostridiaceae bacterium]|nr:fumarate hydratase [Clostridiaceae bacterium]
MRDIECSSITAVIADLCQKANRYLPSDLNTRLAEARQMEVSPAGQAVLDELLANAELAASQNWPICQDTGMAVVFVEMGQEVHIAGGNLEEAINLGVAQGYREGYLRNSVVDDPLLRVNTGNNTPAVIHYQIVPGDCLRLTVAPKGFGSENMSAARMLSPSEGLDGIRRFVLSTVENAGPNPCPPVVIGIGIGGTLEKAALLAKQALLLPVCESNSRPHIARLEQELLAAINDLGIGPAGLGGRITALTLHILCYPTHIAGLPVVLNMGCHATRHAEASL